MCQHAPRVRFLCTTLFIEETHFALINLHIVFLSPSYLPQMKGKPHSDFVSSFSDLQLTNHFKNFWFNSYYIFIFFILFLCNLANHMLAFCFLFSKYQHFAFLLHDRVLIFYTFEFVRSTFTYTSFGLSILFSRLTFVIFNFTLEATFHPPMHYTSSSLWSLCNCFDR